MGPLVLHTYSNWKWTGPADHALNLVAWLAARGEFQTLFACGRSRGRPNHIRLEAEQRGLPLANGLLLDKHLNWRILPDIVRLRRWVRRRGIQLIHSHQENDSLTAVLAGCGSRLVRSVYDGEVQPLSARRRFTLSRTACILTASARVQAQLAQAFPAKPVLQVDIAVDLDRFRPMPKNPALCREFGLQPQEVVAGIVARVQQHRGFPLLLEALAAVVREIPGYRFLIVGRGTHIDALVREPVRRMGLGANVILTGYRRRDYVDVLNLMDYTVFWHPGSDGSCRAAREALACGRPVVASRTGILPELIRNGETGLLVEADPQPLAEALVACYRRDDLRRRLARAARAYAEAVLDPHRYTKTVSACYRHMTGAR
jgi:glycosyltransferase involved in cell wall biosynthesis